MAQKVFESIYRAHRDHVYGFALRLTGFDPDAAEELTQESFYRAFVALPRFRGDCDVRTWLCQIMKHTFYKQLRKARTRQRAALRAGEADAQADPHAVFERESLYRAALAEIGRMKPKQRDVVVLRLFSGLSFAQIAAALHISENSAKVIYHRARVALQKKLEQLP